MHVPKGVAMDKMLDEQEHADYRKVVGRLNWAAYRTRPDITAGTQAASSALASPTWDDVVSVNKSVRTAVHHASVGIRILPMGKDCRIIALLDASFNRHIETPSIYAGLFFISDWDSDFNQELFTVDPNNCTQTEPILVKGTLVFWRSRIVARRVDSIMDVETLSIQYGSVVSEYLHNMLLELGLARRWLKPVLFNDNNSTITHIKSTNKHNNPRMNVMWSTLRTAYNQNKFGLRFLCGKTKNISDVLTKVKSSLTNLLYRCLRLGKIFVNFR
jgi:hypothetical protein